MASWNKLRSVRCNLLKGHTGLCVPGSTRFEEDDLCILNHRTIYLFEANACVVTYADKWPELDTLPPHWSAVVDAEMDVVCFVPPHSGATTTADLQADSKQRAQIICDILNAVQNENIK